MTNAFRLAEAGRIDRTRPLWFEFDGRALQGFAGDTLASALLANGVHLVARSIKFHRPRGAMTAGAEEPNALVQLERGAFTEPNLRATEIELYDGLQAFSVNCWPSLGFDLRALHALAAPILVAGFYNKTFKWPARFWQKLYEPAIRAAAGQGVAPAAPDPDRYDRMHWHGDLLVVGAGPAGLAAALPAARAGVRLVVVDENASAGGSLLARSAQVDGLSGGDWAARAAAELEALPNVLVLQRTSLFGYYDHNYLVALQRRTDHAGPGRMPGVARKRVWHFRAHRVILATGAHDRPIVFGNNDLPGVFLAGAACAFAHRYGVSLGNAGIAFVNNDVGFALALEAHEAARNVTHIVDAREAPEPALLQRAQALGVEVLSGRLVASAFGGTRVQGVVVLPVTGGRSRRIACDHLLVSGGFNPAVHLYSQAPGQLRFDERAACFVPHRTLQALDTAGAINACFSLERAINEGGGAAERALRALGHASEPQALENPSAIQAPEPEDDLRLRPLWSVQALIGRPLPGKHFVDTQNDVTEDDIRLAAREGFRSVEHAKRYTTVGMATDQGKTSNVTALAILADATGRPIPEVGTTTFRPPFTPVTLGALAGRDRDALSDPARITALHEWHVEHGAVFEDVGQWKRPWYFPRPGEQMHAAVERECKAVRTTAGIMDASTLGKIELRGPDAAEFLERVTTNAWRGLAVGACRYGVMCRADGMVFDDGVTARLAEDHFLMSTTTGNAARVLDWLEEWLQTEWPQLRVYCTSVTEQWATVALAGPAARRILQALAPAMDLSAAAFPFMTWREGSVGGIDARVLRISFSGELAYEINVPAWHGRVLWEALIEAGAPHGLTPYGTETMHVLRAEKGYIIVGQETDGSVTPIDLGMAWIVSKKKDFIGRRSLRRQDTAREDRKQLVGLLPADGRFVAPEGAQLVAAAPRAGDPPGGPSVGHVTSSYSSPNLAGAFALALVASGRARHGQTLHCVTDAGTQPMRVTGPVFFDPEGKRRDGTD